MLIENIELTSSHVGLGNLKEYALMILFGNAFVHHIIQGTGITLDQMKDTQGLTLYPAFFMTHLRVPRHSLLSSHKIWQRVDVGVDVKRFGISLLESTYILGRENEVPDNVNEWDDKKYPSMTGNNIIVVDGVGSREYSRQVSAPKPGHIADLPKITKPPPAIKKANFVREHGFENDAFPGKIKNEAPILYDVDHIRDTAPGHALIFAKFCEIMDYAEFHMLFKQLQHGFPVDVLDNLAILEREICYYGNCYAGEILEIYLKGNLEACPADFHGDSLEIISAGILTMQIEIYQKKTNHLLAMAKVKKLITVPSALQNLVLDVKRLISLYS
jgi:probable biosynthetic protein (TIGR04098 family)